MGFLMEARLWDFYGDFHGIYFSWGFRGIQKGMYLECQCWLVVFSHPSEKYECVSWDDDIPNMNGRIQKMATKPPTRSGMSMGLKMGFFMGESFFGIAPGTVPWVGHVIPALYAPGAQGVHHT